MDLSHFNHLKSGSVPLTSTMHFIVALFPISTDVFLGRVCCKIGLVRGIAVNKTTGVSIINTEVLRRALNCFFEGNMLKNTNRKEPE